MEHPENTEAGASPRPDSADREILLIEGWMYLVALFPEAMEVVARTPPANDPG